MQSDSATVTLPEAVSGERRSQPRSRVGVPCQAVAEFDFVLLGERIVDLSARGLLLRVDGVPAELGEAVILTFQPPGSTQWIDVEAKVVRLVTGTHPGAPGLGLELTSELTPFERGHLEAALERARRRSRRKARAALSPSRPRADSVKRRGVVSIGDVAIRSRLRGSAPTPDLARRIVIIA